MRACPVCGEWLIYSTWRQQWICSADLRDCWRAGRDVELVAV